MLCVEFSQVQYIHLGGIVHGLKAVTIVTRGILKLINHFWGLSHFLSDKVSPGWRLKPSLGTQKKCPFLLNKGVPSIEYNKYKDYVNIFPGPNLCPLNGAVPNERFHCGQKIEPTLPPLPLIKDGKMESNLALTKHHSSGRKKEFAFSFILSNMIA